MSAKISVVLSLFKKERCDLFNKAMESIWEVQIRKPDEIVLVQDGPLTEELLKIVDYWKGKLSSKLVVVPLPENVGLARALNEGIKYTSGDYIARMDTDDLSLPNRFFEQEKFLNANPEISLLGGFFIEMDQEGNDICLREMPVHHNDILESIAKTSPFAHPAIMIRRQIFTDGFSYSESCRRCQDIELWFRLLAAGYKGANLNVPILRYRKATDLYEKRRKSAFSELQIYLKGIKLLYGYRSLKYIYPILHYLYRLLPAKWCLYLYKHVIVKYWKNKQ